MHKSEICESCGQRIKKSRQRSKVDADGIQRLPDKREICRTKEAWRERRAEVFSRDHQKDGPITFWECAKCGRCSDSTLNFDVDHKTKRSLKRDDRLSNLQLLGNVKLCGCHEKKHEGFKQKRLQK